MDNKIKEIRKVKETSKITQPDYNTYKHLLNMNDSSRNSLVNAFEHSMSLYITNNEGIITILEYANFMDESNNYTIKQLGDFVTVSAILECNICKKEFSFNATDFVRNNGRCLQCKSENLDKKKILSELIKINNRISALNLKDIVRIQNSYKGIDDSYIVELLIDGEEKLLDVYEVEEYILGEYIRMTDKLKVACR